MSEKDRLWDSRSGPCLLLQEVGMADIAIVAGGAAGGLGPLLTTALARAGSYVVVAVADRNNGKPVETSAVARSV